MNASIYTTLPEAIIAGEAFLASVPDLGFIFETNAKGGLDTPPHRDSAQALIKIMDDACGGFSLSSVNEAFGQIQTSAVQSGRTVLHYKKGGTFFTEISPVRN